MHSAAHHVIKVLKILAISVFVAILYIQVMVIRGFNIESFVAKDYRVELRPQSLGHFGGLYWGLIRLDEEDKLDIGVSVDIKSSKNFSLRLEKDGQTLVTDCKATDPGRCYGLFRRDDMRMSGKFRLFILKENKIAQVYDGEFVRKHRPMYLLWEAMLSV